MGKQIWLVRFTLQLTVLSLKIKNETLGYLPFPITFSSDD